MTISQIKSMAKSLRLALAARHMPLSHGDCLELVARQFGFGDWNTLVATLPAAGTAPERGSAATARWEQEPTCSFCGRRPDSVRSLIEGGCSRARRAPHACVFICDECVALCAEVNAVSAMPNA